MKTSHKIALFVLLVGLSDQVFSQSLKWHSDHERYYFEGCADYMIEAHNEAAAKLSQYSIELEHTLSNPEAHKITCGIQSPFGSNLSLPGLEYKDFHILDSNLTTLATTRVWYYKFTLIIAKAEIFYNTFLLREDDMEQVQRTVEHEIHHFLGANHHTSTKSVMYKNENGATQTHALDIQVLMEKYGYCDYSAVDGMGNRYSPKVLVNGEFYWTVEELTGGKWSVLEYGESDCV